MTLIDKVKNTLDNLEVKLIGNRLTALGYSLALGGLVGEGLNSNNLNYSLFATGLILSLATSTTAGTIKAYRKAKTHVRNGGELNENFFEEVLNENSLYCTRQGLYLAVRKYGEIEKFNLVAKQKRADLIPNF